MKNAVMELVKLVVILVASILIDLPLLVAQVIWFGFAWFIKANPTSSDIEIASLLGVESWWDEQEV